MERALAAVEALAAKLTPEERAAMGRGDPQEPPFFQPPRFPIPTLDKDDDAVARYRCTGCGGITPYFRVRELTGNGKCICAGCGMETPD